MNTIPPQFLNYLKLAIETRMPLLERWEQEGTTCYRLFHGAVERWPSVTIDRYGDTLVFQTWRADLHDEVVGQMAEYIAEKLYHEFFIVWVDRRNRGQAERHCVGDAPPAELIGTELGLQYRVDAIHRGIDPLLFFGFSSG